ncbi:MAG: DUF2807 domain-containing protein [Bacteroides sp.]|nr:DUF2807 domain-containing protein [Bacteroides sp.]
MKRFVLLLSAMLLCTSTIFGQVFTLGNKKVKASNVYVTKQIKIDDFDRLEVAGSMDVVYKQVKGKPSLEIYTADNIVDLVKTEVVNGTLKIGFKKGYSISYNKLIIRVSSEDINAISLAGSGSIDLANGVKTNKMNISLAGSGDVTGKNIFCQEDLRIALSGSGDVSMQQLACNQFDVSLAGSGDVLMKDVNVHTAKVSLAGSGCVEIYGKTDKSHFELAGSGEILAAGFEAKEVNVSIAGSGDVECHATDHLKVSISGSGEVGYKGNPQLELPKRGVHKL